MHSDDQPKVLLFGLGARIAPNLADAPDADVAFVATTSFVAEVEPIINDLLDRGMNVVTICEQLGFGFGFYDHEPVARRIDERARRAGLTVLGTGCNPGILLDTLPLLLSSLTVDVNRVTIRRTAEMSGYGGILSKFGFGLTVAHRRRPRHDRCSEARSQGIPRRARRNRRDDRLRDLRERGPLPGRGQLADRELHRDSRLLEQQDRQLPVNRCRRSERHPVASRLRARASDDGGPAAEDVRGEWRQVTSGHSLSRPPHVTKTEQRS